MLPPINPPPLPQELIVLRNQLRSETSILIPILFQKLIDTYIKQNLPEAYRILLYNDTLISVALLVPKYCTQFLSVLLAEDCIPSLLWILTYSQHAPIAIQLLPRAIVKEEGVRELIITFGKGDNKAKLRNLAVKVLSTPPAK